MKGTFMLIKISSIFLAAISFAGLLRIGPSASMRGAPTTLNSGNDPFAVAVNPATNKTYVANFGDANVSIIDEATQAVTQVSVGTHPAAIAINPVSNTIYVANHGDGTVTAINGN